MLEDVWQQRFERTMWPREQGAIQDWLIKTVKTQEQWDTYYHVSPLGDWQNFGIVGNGADDGGGEFTKNSDYMINVMFPASTSWIFHAVSMGVRTVDDQSAIIRTIYEHL